MAQAVECAPEDRLEVAGVAVDRGDGDDQVEDLLEGEVVADLVSALHKRYKKLYNKFD